MPFCANCGSSADGKFCAKCGAPIAPAPGGTAPQPDPAPSYTPPPSAAAPGMEDNVAATLCYVLGLVTGILFLVLEPYNKNRSVRFHAFQSIFLHIALLVIWIGLGLVLHWTWFLLWPLRGLVALLSFLLWLYCMYKAYNREQFELPFVGPLAAKQANS